MTTAAIRQELHHLIDVADDVKVEAMYNMIQSNMSNGKYTPAELAEFYDRLEKYNKDEMPGFSIEEAHDYVRKNKKA